MFVRRLAGVAAFAVALALGAIPAAAGPTALTLINGWKPAPSGTAKPSVSLVRGIVHLRGAIWTKASNNSVVPFVVPAPFRPSTLVYFKTDMCNATNGRIYIQPDGTANVQAENDAANAKCMTSLDGATYAVSPEGFKTLKLRHGWQPYSGGTGIPAARLISGIVRFTGAMSSGGTNALPFIMPATQRPSARVYVPVDTSGATNGRLVIQTDGSVTVEGEFGLGSPSGFTSLEGVWYARDTAGFTPLSLINGWTSSTSFTATPGVQVINGVVHFQGAIQTGGNNAVPFVLPVGFRPVKNVFVTVDMCSATHGQIGITPDGTATVMGENSFGNAACFTSLDGASFHL